MNHGRKKKQVEEISPEEKKKQEELAVKVLEMSTKFFSIRKNPSLPENSLDMINIMAQLCPDFSSIYNFRREILNKMFETMTPEQIYDQLNKDMDFTFNLLKKNSKSYSIWNHRQWVVLKSRELELSGFQPKIKIFQKEIMICNKMLELDERNFHTWNYRNWILKEVLKYDQKYIDSEIQFTKSKIENNFGNFSAFHFRSKQLFQKYRQQFLTAPLTKENLSLFEEHLTQMLPSTVCNEELEIVKNAIFIQPNEQGIWQYYKWLHTMQIPFSVLSLHQKNVLENQEKNYVLSFYVVASKSVSSLKQNIQINFNKQAIKAFDVISAQSGTTFSNLYILEVHLEQQMIKEQEIQNELLIEFLSNSQVLSSIDSADTLGRQQLIRELEVEGLNFIQSQFSVILNKSLEITSIKRQVGSKEWDRYQQPVLSQGKFVDEVLESEPENSFALYHKIHFLKTKMYIEIMKKGSVCEANDIKEQSETCESCIKILQKIQSIVPRQRYYIEDMIKYWQVRMQLLQNNEISKQISLSSLKQYQFDIQDLIPFIQNFN